MLESFSIFWWQTTHGGRWFEEEEEDEQEVEYSEMSSVEEEFEDSDIFLKR